MQIIFSRLTSAQYIDPPFHLLGWIGWFVLLLAFGLAFWRWREPFPVQNIRRGLVLAGLAVLAVLGGLFLGVRLPGDALLPVPMIPVERSMPAVMLLAAVPWVLGAGILGPLPGALLGAIGGLVLSLFDTHSIYTTVQLAGLALLVSVSLRQRYRTAPYQFLRHPLGAAVVLAFAFAPVYMFSSFFEVNGSLAVRLDYAITQSWPLMLARGVELIIGGLVGEAVRLAFPRFWPRPALLVPSPSESSLQKRFFYTTMPLVLGLILALIITDWLVAGAASRRMVEDRLRSTAEVAADSLPYFVESGQNLLINMASPDLTGLAGASLRDALASRLRSVPYFRQLFLFDLNGNPVGGYPSSTLEQIQPTEEEIHGIDLALKGVLIQNYIIPPVKSETTAQVSFLALVQDAAGSPRGVLLGRTDLNSNPFTQPAIQALETVRKDGGEGVILDENKRMLYNANPSMVMTNYVGSVPEQSQFFDDHTPTGTRLLVYAQPVPGQAWTIMLSEPAEKAQQHALNIAVPLLAILLFASLLVFLLVRLGLRSVTRSLASLSAEATRISSGELSHPLAVGGEDEVGRLGSAFETMRLSLKARLEELNRLLVVSQGVASSLDVRDAVKPILEAALADGASSARIVLQKDVTLDPQVERVFSFGAGPAAAQFAYLDEQIFEMMRHTETLTVPNTARMRRFNFPAGRPHPSAILARPLYHENTYFGVLWLGYDQTHIFLEELTSFFSTLAGQAALAAANASLYATAEVGRQRLEAVLASSPEPVLVMDEKGCLLLLNPAALQVPGLVSSSAPGKPLDEVIPLPALRDLISTASGDRRQAQEITLPSGRTYYVSVSAVSAEGQLVGKVCLLQDITHYKELDSLKSEFVATVSHDLRAPLTLMRGYSTMLQMVGDLNEQQKSYIQKINQGVDMMTRLVNNLLDLGRIEAGVDLQLEKISVTDLVEQVCLTLQPQAIQKNITLSQEMPSNSPVIIEGDSALFQQAIYNLVENAIKYTQVGGRVCVRLQPLPNSMLLEVQDNGIGIAPLDLPRLFEKFFRSGRREAYQQRGTGLGLAIVKSIAERHNGRITVDSTLGKGSTFFLEVPYRQPAGVVVK